MDPEEQQPQDWRDLLIQLSRAYQSNAPTDAQRGYVPGIQTIFDPQIAAIASGFSKPPQDTRLSEDELFSQFAPDFFFYTENDPNSLEARTTKLIYNKQPLNAILKQIRADYDDEIKRLEEAGIAPTAIPTVDDYITVAKDLYGDYKKVKSEEAKQNAAWNKAKAQPDIFTSAGLPKPDQPFSFDELGQFFPEQIKTIQQRIEQRLPTPTMPKFAKEQFTPYGPSIEVSKAAGQTAKQKADVEKRRQQVQDELNKIINQKAAQAGFTPLAIEAVRRLQVGR